MCWKLYCSNMCADICIDEYDEAIEYGFDVLSIVKQKSVVSQLNASKIEKLPQSFEIGRVLCVKASVLRNCQRWSVNLLCGENHSADIAFHFNPRLLQHCVVRNARIKGQWGNEEYLTPGKFEMKNGEEFLLKIYATDRDFHISYNGNHVCSFSFRIPLMNVTHVEINGMVDIYKISMETFDRYPEKIDDLKIVRELDGSLTNITSMRTEAPMRALLPEGLPDEWQLEVYGIPKILPQSFSVELSNNVFIWPSNEILLQLTAIFGSNMLVRNAFIGNKWGMEERGGGFKFLPSTPFSLWIRKSARKFSIWVNETLQAEFAHRCNANIAKAVHIHGDVYVNGIFINKDPEKYFRRTPVSSNY